MQQSLIQRRSSGSITAYAVFMSAKLEAKNSRLSTMLGGIRKIEFYQAAVGLGYGYNFTRDRTQAISMVPILDPEYVKKNNLRHSSGIQAKMTDNSYTGHSLNEVANNFAATANLGGGIFGFKGEVGASFGVSKTTSSEHEYALSVIDAYVDAELSEFDISKDLSLEVRPTVIQNRGGGNPLQAQSVGLSCFLNF
jgi:hypothetical protein